MVTVYFLVRMEKRLEKLTEAINDLAKVEAEMKMKQAETKTSPEREQY